MLHLLHLCSHCPLIVSTLHRMRQHLLNLWSLVLMPTSRITKLVYVYIGRHLLVRGSEVRNCTIRKNKIGSRTWHPRRR